MRTTTRSIIVSAVSVALVAGGGIGVAMSIPARNASLATLCQAAVAGERTTATIAPTPTETATSVPTSMPTCPPTSTPPSSSGSPAASATALPTGLPTVMPTGTPTETLPPPRPVPAPPTCSEPPTEAEIKAVFVGWNDALANNADKVAERYAEDGVLLSTLKDKFFKGRAEIRGYFADFLLKRPQATVTDRKIVILETKGAADTGLYTFNFGNGDDPVKARFTFVYKVIDKKCLIVSHHSSKMPERP